jgi:hypothetical protein
MAGSLNDWVILITITEMVAADPKPAALLSYLAVESIKCNSQKRGFSDYVEVDYVNEY